MGILEYVIDCGGYYNFETWPTYFLDNCWLCGNDVTLTSRPPFTPTKENNSRSYHRLSQSRMPLEGLGELGNRDTSSAIA
jgi:hypothetical protein